LCVRRLIEARKTKTFESERKQFNLLAAWLLDGEEIADALLVLGNANLFLLA